MINTRQKCSTRLLSISRKFLMQSMNQRTLMWLYGCVNVSLEMRNVNYMLHFVNMNICLMVFWEHGKMNPLTSNFRKGLSHIIADLSLPKVHECTLKASGKCFASESVRKFLCTQL